MHVEMGISMLKQSSVMMVIQSMEMDVMRSVDLSLKKLFCSEYVEMMKFKHPTMMV
jgi:hypothetical protein